MEKNVKNQTYRISSFCEVKSGKRLPLGCDFSTVPTEYKYIRARDIKNGKIDISDCAYIDDFVKAKIKKYIIEKNDIAITVVANIGDVGICDADADGANLTENAVRLTNFNSRIVFPKYLAYYLAQPFMKQYMEGLAIGAAQAKLGIYKVNNISVELPSVEEQEKIANIINKYDNLIENNNKRIKILEQMAENLYKEWFVRFRFPGHETTPFENGIPKGWAEKRLSDLIDVDPLLPIKKGIQVKSIPMEALSTDSMIVDENCIQLVDNPSGSHSQNGDTLVARITPCLENGKTGFVQCLDDGETATGSTEFIVLRSKELSPYYVYCFARSLYFRQTAILSMNGADGRQRVNVPKIKSMKIAKPSNEIIKRFDSIAKPIFEEIYLLTKQNKNNIKQRDLLLPRLMSGKLAV